MNQPNTIYMGNAYFFVRKLSSLPAFRQADQYSQRMVAPLVAEINPHWVFLRNCLAALCP